MQKKRNYDVPLEHEALEFINTIYRRYSPNIYNKL